MLIPLDQIAVVERRRKDLGDIAALAESIKANGQITAAVVRPAVEADREKGVDPAVTPWVLVAGGRRFAAIMMTGLDVIRADDLGELSPMRQKILELEENLNRKELHWAEEAFLREEIHKLRQLEFGAAQSTTGEGWSARDTARELNMTPGNLSKDLKLAQALRENPALKNAPTKASAVRMLDFNTKMEQRIAAVDGAALHTASSKLVTADMRDFVRTLPTHSVDLCFTDFPFGIDYNFDAEDRNKYADSQGALQDLLVDVVPEIIRVTKPSGWLALMMGSTNYEFLRECIEDCCAEHFDYADTWYEESGSGWQKLRKGRCNSFKNDPSKQCRYLSVEDPEWIWFRPNSRNPSMWPTLHAQNQFEKICVVNMGNAVLVQQNKPNVLMYDAIYEDRIHEMQRPHDLCLDIVSRFTLGGERVLDLCFGSGSALAAAAELQRDYLGCDLNPANLGPALGWVAQHARGGL